MKYNKTLNPRSSGTQITINQSSYQFYKYYLCSVNLKYMTVSLNHITISPTVYTSDANKYHYVYCSLVLEDFSNNYIKTIGNNFFQANKKPGSTGWINFIFESSNGYSFSTEEEGRYVLYMYISTSGMPYLIEKLEDIEVYLEYEIVQSIKADASGRIGTELDFYNKSYGYFNMSDFSHCPIKKEIITKSPLCTISGTYPDNKCVQIDDVSFNKTKTFTFEYKSASSMPNNIESPYVYIQDELGNTILSSFYLPNFTTTAGGEVNRNDTGSKSFTINLTSIGDFDNEFTIFIFNAHKRAAGYYATLKIYSGSTLIYTASKAKFIEASGKASVIFGSGYSIRNLTKLSNPKIYIEFSS